MSKIGICITTTPKRKVKENFYKHTSPDTLIFVHSDDNGLGVSQSRNNGIKHLIDNGCDYLILFDDDCYPLMCGYEKYFIDEHIKSNIHHFAISESFKSNLKHIDENFIHYYDGVIGCFRFMTKKFIETVGYFNTKYNKYGFEDAAYTERAKKSGLYGNLDGYPTPHKSMFYIHSEDVYAENPNINFTYEEKLKFIEENRPIYIEEITSDSIYLPYNQ